MATMRGYLIEEAELPVLVLCVGRIQEQASVEQCPVHVADLIASDARQEKEEEMQGHHGTDVTEAIFSLRLSLTPADLVEVGFE